MAHQSALSLAFEVGETLLENGAEIFRVQETMQKVAAAFDVTDLDVYVLTNALFANGTENGISKSTKLKFVPSSSIHFGRISAINQLSREISANRHTVEQAHNRLIEIKAIPYSSLRVTTIACAVGSAGFGYLMGGSAYDSACAFICGLFLEPFLYTCRQRGFSKFITNLLASFLMALFACIIFSLGFGDSVDKIVVGSIIRLVPGVALTTSIRDFLNGDYLSGTIRLIDAFLIGAYIAIGVGVVVSTFPGITGIPIRL